MYVSAAQLAQRVKISSPTTVQEEQLTLAIQSAMAQIDGLCGRSFEAISSTALFTALRTNIVDLGYASSISLVEIDQDNDSIHETVVPVDQYILSVDTRSRRFLQLIANSIYIFPLTQNSVKVTGIFGVTSPPPEIQQATLLQAARLWKRQDAIFAEIRSENGLMRLTSDFDLDAKRILSDTGWLRSRNIVMV